MKSVPDHAPGAVPDPLRHAPGEPVRGRGATFNPGNRYRRDTREACDDGWATSTSANDGTTGAPPGGASPRQLRTTVAIQRARTIISRNDSPDIPFTQSINPYQGCEHGCIYCYARPSHAYLDLSPGLDFETHLFAKPDAAALLRAELARPGYVCDPINLGSNTDPYQPIERDWKITRAILELLAAHQHPFTIVTKSALVERDLDLIAPMAAKHMARVFVSLPTLDRELARKLEPRAVAPQRRLETLRTLSSAGVPTGVFVAPIIPQLNDRELEAIVAAAAAHGATSASWTMLRLPREVAPLFRAWLDEHFPLRAAHVMSIVQQVRGGRDNDSRFGARMRGTGNFADLVAARFALAVRRAGLAQRHAAPLDTSRFRPPRASVAQGELF
ncbi:MAG: PA0069 family radical SAM protein [Burkholderiales bacterium]|nr:PA0069 family radical SAM protein [Burkholderiales bacterium]